MRNDFPRDFRAGVANVTKRISALATPKLLASEPKKVSVARDCGRWSTSIAEVERFSPRSSTGQTGMYGSSFERIKYHTANCMTMVLIVSDVLAARWLVRRIKGRILIGGRGSRDCGGVTPSNSGNAGTGFRREMDGGDSLRILVLRKHTSVGGCPVKRKKRTRRSNKWHWSCTVKFHAMLIAKTDL